ncbi:phosphate signaling complex protein PhoU [Asticcacaulis solisilvae]|uniref:phosphate signaling complex protein PhoU n=1 Tax=Asticcacaulis solisilvae TaxID=1217274 RepID=UPI003FD841AE
MNPHIVKTYEEELDQLSAEVVLMGGLAEAQVADAVEAVARRDVALAQSVVQRDHKLDELEKDVERKCIRLIALRQPMADDLRKTVAAMKIATSLERIGDLAKNISKRSLVIAEAEPMSPLTRSIERMGKLVSSRLRDVLDAYKGGRQDLAQSVWASDTEIDEHYNALFRELLTYMMGDPRTISACTHLLFMAKNLERIGDHATNMAEHIHYELTGEDYVEDRPKGDTLHTN